MSGRFGPRRAQGTERQYVTDEQRRPGGFSVDRMQRDPCHGLRTGVATSGSRRPWVGVGLTLLLGVCTVLPRPVGGQGTPTSGFERILDQYVRDGFVYYAALKVERQAFDRVVASLAERPRAFEAWSAERRLAYWINAYNALVLRAVIDAYPIRGASADFPAASVMQIPGMFAGREHQIAGERLTLELIEEERIAPFGDPRAHLALGRGAVGSPRLRSEPFRELELETQLEAVVADFATTPRHFTVDRGAGQVVVSALLGWRPDRFAALSGADDSTGRSALQWGVVSLIAPALFPSERAFLAENTFRFSYHEFDWRLNDLTGGRP